MKGVMGNHTEESHVQTMRKYVEGHNCMPRGSHSELGIILHYQMGDGTLLPH
jgi:hypothetical protein